MPSELAFLFSRVGEVIKIVMQHKFVTENAVQNLTSI